MTLVRLDNVTKDYLMGTTSVRALDGISMEVEKGEFVALVGPSGCGKTTLLNILGLLDRPTSGKVLLEGKDTSQSTDNQESDRRLAQIGFIFQNFNLVPVLNVFENVEVPLVLAKSNPKARKDKVEHLLASVGLSEFLEHRPDELSGGQRQRVAIARALVNSPSLILADEPTANLDSGNGAKIMEIMAELNRKQGVTFFMTTHNPDLLRYASRIIHLRDGRIED